MSTRKLGTDRKCHCKKARAKSSRDAGKKSAPKDNCKRKRQTLVFNPEEETWAEPYMHSLRREFSEASLICDSKVELPWKDIALQTKGMKIRGEVVIKRRSRNSDSIENSIVGDLEKKESTGAMALPWKDLVVSGTVQEQPKSTIGIDQCDSKLEIPWDILALDSPVKINPLPEAESCIPEDVEIPWNDLMIPSNIVIEAKKIIEHPSNRYPSRSAASGTRRGCPSCIKAKK